MFEKRLEMEKGAIFREGCLTLTRTGRSQGRWTIRECLMFRWSEASTLGIRRGWIFCRFGGGVERRSEGRGDG